MALTHSTYAYEHDLVSNERLEFLGDAVLQLVISEHLYYLQPELPEGEMTKLRSLVVCERSLAAMAMDNELNNYLRLGKGEQLTGGAIKPSNLANAMEAAIGAIYIDGGLEAAKTFILRIAAEYSAAALSGTLVYDHKSKLLELSQSRQDMSNLAFAIVAEEGPVHDRSFTAVVRWGDRIISTGVGKSKKAAEQEAARQAIEVLAAPPANWN